MIITTVAGWVADLIHAANTVQDRIDPVAGRHAQRAAELARSTVPVETGRLRSSIEVERLPGEGVAWAVGSDVEYGRFVEHGTAAMPPQPFLGPAGDAVHDKYARDVLDVAADL